MPQIKNAAFILCIFVLIVINLPQISYGLNSCDTGVCVEVFDCPSAKDSIRMYGKHDLERCGWNKLIEKVCCLDDGISASGMASTSSEEDVSIWNDNDNKISSTTTMMPGSTTKKNEPRGTVRKSEEVCATYAATVPFGVDVHILGGDAAAAGEFPHMVALGYPNPDEVNTLLWICGGTLISESYILTAAHCVTRTRPVMVLVGVLNITEQSTTRKEYNIANITVHPGYTRRNGTNDIALLQTTEFIVFGSNIYPACLYQRSDDPLGLIITGWGRLALGQDLRSEGLQKARVTAVPLPTCNETYVAGINRQITINQICAGSADVMNPTDSCPGDSGGPMQILSQDNVMYFIVGIISFGLTDCGGGAPSVYTRIYAYLDWIESVVWT